MAISHTPPLNLAEIKRTAQAMIYFETLLGALEGEHTRVPHPNRERDIENLRRLRRADEAASIQLEEKSSLDDVMSAMEAGARHRDGTCGRVDCEYGRQHAEFVICSPRGRDTGEDLIEFAEFALFFVEAALSCPLGQLRCFPPTFQGLRSFMVGRGRAAESLHDGGVLLNMPFHDDEGRRVAKCK